MITQYTIDELGFEFLEDYFDYILESKINGQHKQARELFNKLSEGMQGQRAAFFDYVETLYHYETSEETGNPFEELKEYFNKN
jgi:hypothetical protein